MPNTQPLKVGFLLYPHVTPLDFIGPAQVFAAAGSFELHHVWKDTQPVMSDAGLALVPTVGFADCPELDVLLVPGGPGQALIMQDADVLRWLSTQGKQAQWVTSVCSGSLLLGAAGLVAGYRAASHWNYREYLPLFDAQIDTARVAIDRNRITGGGVTAGIDLALHLVAQIRGNAPAQEVQLFLEYAPEPPFECGRPENATPEVVAAAKLRLLAQVEAVHRLAA